MSADGMIAGICAYIARVWAGVENPFWPHLILITVSVVAGLAVAIGIVLEQPRFTERTHRIATLLVLVGVGIESLCTVLLFVTDERISGAQQAKIIALETLLAPRNLSPTEQFHLRVAVGQFAGQTYAITTYWDMREPLHLANQIYQTLNAVAWSYIKPTSATVLLGGTEGVQVWTHPKASSQTKAAAAALIKALEDDGITAEAKEQNERNPVTNQIDINVGTKPIDVGIGVLGEGPLIRF